MVDAQNPIRVVSGGDVMFVERLAGIPCLQSPPVQRALQHLTQADVCFLNCEMPLTRRGHKVEKTVNLRSDPELAPDLATLGADVVTVANNHMLDYGYDGMFETLDALAGAGIAHVGAGATVEAAFQPHVREVKGRRLAFLGVAATLPPGFAAGDDRPGIAPIRVSYSFEVNANLMSEQPGTAPTVRTQAVAADVAHLQEVIAGAKARADHVIVAMHWGTTRRRVTPWQGLVAEYQPPLGRAMIDAGADVVLGNHSHNLHGVEVYHGRPIFYSLGNLIFQEPRGYMEPESVIVLLDFGPDGLRCRLVPILVNDRGFPEVPDQPEQDRIFDLLASLSEPYGTRFTPRPDGIEVVLDS